LPVVDVNLAHLPNDEIASFRFNGVRLVVVLVVKVHLDIVHLILFAVAVLVVAVLALAWILAGYWLGVHLLLVLTGVDLMVLAWMHFMVLAWVDLVVLPAVEQVQVDRGGLGLPLLLLEQLERAWGGLELEYCTSACTSCS